MCRKDKGSWRELDDSLIYYKNYAIYNTHLRI